MIVDVFIPMKLEPIERGERFDLPLCDLFDETDGGDVLGGGTYGKNSEILGVQVEIELVDESLLPEVAKILRDGGAPPEGTELKIYESEDAEARIITLAQIPHQ